MIEKKQNTDFTLQYLMLKSILNNYLELTVLSRYQDLINIMIMFLLLIKIISLIQKLQKLF